MSSNSKNKMVPTPRAKDDGSEHDVSKLARIELARLQRQYRLIEDQRHGYTQQSGLTARTTYRIVENLRIEKENLQPDLTNANCPANQARAKLAEATIVETLDRFDRYQVIIQKEIRHIKEMEEQVDKISERTVKQKLKIQSLYGISITPAKASHNLNNSENKLHHVRTLFDEKCHQNSALRLDIKNLLRDRTRFHNKFNSLKIRIGKLKNQMLHVVHQAAQTYDNRDEAVTKIRAIREREFKESKQHILEVKEFQRVLHHDHKIHRFLVKKNTARNVFEDTAQRRLRKDEHKEKEVDEMLQKYQQSIREILSTARFESVDKLCVFYEDLEQQNFAKFRYITDITHEKGPWKIMCTEMTDIKAPKCETLKDAVGIIKGDIDLTQEVVGERLKSRKAELKSRQDNIFAKQELLRHLETVIDQTMGKLGKLVQGIATAFDLAKCSNSSVLRLLGNQSGVSQRNALLCLGILEHQTITLKFEKSTLEVRKGVELKGQSLHSYKTYQPSYTKPKPQGGPYKVNVIIPNHLGTNADEDDEKDMSDRPYYFEEMRAYVHHQMRQDGLISDRKFEPSASDFPTGEVSKAPSSQVSLMDKVTSKKNARHRAQQEQERNLIAAKSQAAIADKSGVKNADHAVHPQIDIVNETKTNKTDDNEHKENMDGGFGGRGSPEEGQEVKESGQQGYTLTWASSTEETYVPTTVPSSQSSENLQDSVQEE